MSEAKTVGAVIVNYNTGPDLLDCVASLRSEGLEQIVVVDNGSRDGSDEALIQADPKVILLRLDNPGMGTAMNYGAKKLDTDIVFCLNPDTRTHPGAIGTLLEVINSDPKIAMVGPRLLNEDGTLYPSARDFPDFKDSVGHAVLGMIAPNNPWTRRYKRLDHDYETRAEVDWVSGAAMFTRRAAWEQMGGFDPAYFLYMEDVDLCWRLRKAGWSIVYEPRAELTHIGGTTTTQMPYKMLKVHHQSAIRYNFKTVSGLQRVLLPVVAAGLLLRLPVALAQRWLADRRSAKQ